MSGRASDREPKPTVAGPYAFVPTDRRTKRGAVLYVRVCSSVYLADCSLCGAKVGILCSGVTGYHVTTHSTRRSAAASLRRLGIGTKVLPEPIVLQDLGGEA